MMQCGLLRRELAQAGDVRCASCVPGLGAAFGPATTTQATSGTPPAACMAPSLEELIEEAKREDADEAASAAQRVTPLPSRPLGLPPTPLLQ